MHEESWLQFSELATAALDEFWGSLASPSAAGSVPADATQSLQGYLKLIQLMQGAAEPAELYGLQTICAMLEANLQAILAAGRSPTQAEHALLEEWPELLMEFMVDQADIQVADGMIKNLASSAWPLPLSVEDGELVRDMLVDTPNLEITPALSEQIASGQARAIPAQDEAPSEKLAGPASATAGDAAPGLNHPAGAEPLPLELQQVESEMLDMLSNEFALMDKQMGEDLATAIGSQFSADERGDALGNYIDALERQGTASEAVGLVALGEVCLRLITMLKQLGEGIGLSHQALLKQLPGRMNAYLTWPSDSSTAAALIDLLSDAIWSHPFPAEQGRLLLASLSRVDIQDGAAQRPKRQSEATDEDVSLRVPDDINAELLDGLLQELPLQTAAFTAAIALIAAGQGSASELGRAMRAAHTLKGAANTVGVKGIANLTHHLEDILVALSDEGVMPNAQLAAMLVNAGDCLEAMSEALLGVGPVPDQASEILQSVLDYANLIDNEGVSVVASEEASSPRYGVEPSSANETSIPAQPAGLLEQAPGVRVSAPLVDELLRLAGETLISNSQIQDRLRQTVKQTAAMQQQQQLVAQLVAELESLVDIRDVAAPNQKARGSDAFDPLEFDNFSELHTVSRRLIEASADSQQIMHQVNEQFDTLSDLLEIQQRLQMANQHAVMSTRLVPVSSVSSRLQRSVRQTCRLLDKKVDLYITGESTNIDSNVLADLLDPLMHLLRNSVDHGIELPEKRVAAGKSATGRIDLGFSREGNSIVLRCKDDGAGLDYESIRRIAESRGMIAPERNPTPEELARLILINGFSTRNETTQVSGRGVGMDVVYDRVLQMKGTLALDCASGTGLAVELRLPATLLSAHSLIVRHGEKLIAVSSRGVEDIHYVTAEQIEYIGTQAVYRVGNAVHNLVKLENLLGMRGDRREHQRSGFPVLLTRMEDGVMKAIMVQEILDGRDVVLKNFGRYVAKIHGVIGAVILGDGSVAPVIDLVDLLRIPVQQVLSEQAASQLVTEPHDDLPDAYAALVVDDSLTARRAAAKVMKEAGYTVRTAIDGLEAVAMLKNFSPDLLLVDMEMPRMNGLELTSHVRNAERTKHIPVIMITSRSTEKHRQQAKSAGVDVYLTKPFADAVLLNHVERLAGR